MRTIYNIIELSEFFRDTLLPYYEKHYRESLTTEESKKLYLDSGLCLCATLKFGTFIFDIMDEIIVGTYLTEAVMEYEHTAKESLLPRIEWMKQFIKDNI